MAAIAARVGLQQMAPSIISSLSKGNTDDYLSKISKNIDVNKLNLGHAQTLLDVNQNYKNGTLDLNHAQNVLDLAKEVKKSGGNYDMLNKKGARYISRIQKEFRHKLNENYYKLVTGGNSKKALKAFNSDGTKYGDKLVDKYLGKLENSIVKDGYPPHIVRNILTKYGGVLPEKLNKMVKKANKKISDDDKKLSMQFNTRDYMGDQSDGLEHVNADVRKRSPNRRTINFSDEDATLSESADKPPTLADRVEMEQYADLTPDIPKEVEVIEKPREEVVVIEEPREEVVVIEEPREEVVVIEEPISSIPAVAAADVTNTPVSEDLHRQIQENKTIPSRNEFMEIEQPGVIETLNRNKLLNMQTEQEPNYINEKLEHLQNQLNKLRNNKSVDTDDNNSYRINFRPIINMTMNGSDDQKKNNNPIIVSEPQIIEKHSEENPEENNMNVLNETEKEIEKSQEYLNKLESVIKIIDRRKNSILYPGIKVSASQSKNNQEGGYWFNNKKKSPFTKDSNQLDLSNSDDNTSENSKDLYVKKNNLIIKNQKSLLKKIYNDMKSLNKNNPDYELQLADLNSKYDNINNQIKFLEKLNKNPNDSDNIIDKKQMDIENKLYFLKEKIKKAEDYIKKTSPSAFRNLHPSYNGGNMNPNIHGNLNLIQKAGFYNKIEESDLQDILNESKNIMNSYNIVSSANRAEFI